MGKIARTIVALDSGAVIALARGDMKTRGKTTEWLRDDARFIVPAPVLAETLRGSRSDAAVYRVFKSTKAVIVDLSGRAGRHAGELLGSSGADPARTVDAMIVAAAVEHKATDIFTSDPKDMNPLSDGTLKVVPL